MHDEPVEGVNCLTGEEKAHYELEKRVKQLEDAIREHRDQHADDRCMLDDDKLYAVLGDGVQVDRRVGDKFEMLKNCARFIENRCEGGFWPNYIQLERARNRTLAWVAMMGCTCDVADPDVGLETHGSWCPGHIEHLLRLSE